MLRAVRKLFAWKMPQRAAKDRHERHLAWDRACRARGMTAREQADELQLRCAWVRLRTKASAKVLKKPAHWREQADELQIRCAWVRLRTKASAAAMRQPARFRDILDRVAADEARTLAAIGGGELAETFLRAYEAAEPMDILSREAAFVVRAETKGAPASIDDAPGLVPELPARKQVGRKTKEKARA